MKKLLIIIIIALRVLVNISAETDSDILNIKVTLSNNEATVQKLLDEISSKYSIVFSYEPSEIDLNRTVKLSYTTNMLNVVLSDLFRNTDTEFKVHAKVIILRKVKPNLPKKKKVTISGIIKDKNSSETLVGSCVYSLETKTGEIANQYGFYSITIPEGTNKIQISCIGYETKVLDTLLQNSIRLDIELKPEIIEVTEVIVTEKQNKLLDFKQGFSRIELKSVKSLPSLFGETDILKNVLLLPGVNSTSEMGGNFQVRGGSWDQNLMLLDEAVVYNSNHLFGLYSTYNPNMIKDIKFYKGGIPAEYGGRVSSVMDVTQKEGNLKTYHVDAGLGIISARMLVEGPIIKDKSSFVIAARRSLFEPYMKYIPNDNAKVLRPYFFDLNTKVNYIFNQNNRLYLSYYMGFDQMAILKEQNQTYGNVTATLRYNHIFNEKIFSNTSLIFSKYKMSVDKSEDSLSWKSNMGLEHYELKNDYVITLQRHKFKFGLQSIFYNFHPGEQIPTGNNIYFTRYKVDDQYSLETALFFDDNIKLFKNFEIQAGLRLSNYNCLGKADVYNYFEDEPRNNAFIKDTIHYGKGKIYQTYNNFEPRITLKYILNETQTITASYNNMKQYVQLVTRTFSPQPYDMWKPSDNYIKPLSADQYSIGWFLHLSEKGYDFSIESFYKTLKNVIEVKAGVETVFNTNVDAAIVQGTGKAYGLEFSAGKTSGKLTGTVSYTYSRSFHTVNSDFIEKVSNWKMTFPTDYDIPHKLNIAGEYQINKRLSLTGNFIYQTGRPASFPSSQFFYMNNLMSNYTGKNQYRLRAFHHLDLGAMLYSKEMANRKWHSYWALSIYNVYNRENEYFSGIRNIPGTRNTEAMSIWIFSVVPSLSYNFKF